MPDGTALAEAVLAQLSVIQGLILQPSRLWKKLGGFQQCLIRRLFMKAKCLQTCQGKGIQIYVSVYRARWTAVAVSPFGFPPPALLKTR